MVTELRKQNLIQSFLIVTIFCGCFWILGYIITLVTRLFMRPFVFPGLIQGGIIGFAACWALLMRCPEKTPQQLAAEDKLKPPPRMRPNESLDEKGADCTIIDGKVHFAYIPKGKLKISYTTVYKVHHDRKPDLYLIQDATDPKIFHPSSDPERIVPEDIGWNAEHVVMEIGDDFPRSLEVNKLEKPKRKLTAKEKQDAEEFGWWLSACIYGLGLLMLLAAHEKAFNIHLEV